MSENESLRARTSEASAREAQKTLAAVYRKAMRIGPRRDAGKERKEELRKQVFSDFSKLRDWFRYHPKTGNIITECPVSLAGLNGRVAELAKLVSKRILISWESRYSRVAREYREMKLKKTIEALIERAVNNVPTRPYVRFKEIRDAGGANAKAARDFIQSEVKRLHGLIAPKSVNWADFYELFVEYRARCSRETPELNPIALSICEPRTGDRRAIISYAVALEIRMEDKEWVSRWDDCIRELEEWLGEAWPTMPKLSRIAAKFNFATGQRVSKKAEIAKIQSAIRQKRCRARKTAAKKRDAGK